MLKETANTLLTLSLAATPTVVAASLPQTDFSESAISQAAHTYDLNVFRGALNTGAVTHNEKPRFIPLSSLEEPEEESLWDFIDAIVSEVPDEEWDKLPFDLSENLDSYLYLGKAWLEKPISLILHFGLPN